MPQKRSYIGFHLAVLYQQQTHGKEEHTSSQEAAWNLSSHSVALQAQIFKPCNCHGAVDAELLRFLSSTCDCPKAVRRLKSLAEQITRSASRLLRLRHIRLISAASSVPCTLNGNHLYQANIYIHLTSWAPIDREYTGEASIDEIKGEVKICQLAQ